MNYPVAILNEQRVVAILQNASTPAVPMSAVAPAGPKGDPGGNIMAIGLFEDADTLSVPVGTDMVKTLGFSVPGRGSAEYIYDVDIDAAYVSAHPLVSFISSNSRGFRLNPFQQVHVDMAGAIGDYNGTTGTDNAVSFAAIMEYLQDYANAIPDVGSLWFVGLRLSFANGGRYYTTEPLNITTSLIEIDFAGSEIVVPANTIGIIVNDYLTDGEAGTRTSGPFPDQMTLRRPTVRGHNGTNLFKPGIWVRHKCTIYEPRIYTVSGDGIRIGNMNGMNDGNQNGWCVINGFVQRCGGSGLHVQGGDSNAGMSLNFTADLCGRWGIYEGSFLGCTHYNPEVSNCGNLYPGVNTIPAFAYHSGHSWAIVDGQEANTTVTPSTSRPDVWIDTGARPGSDPAIPNWSSGMTMKSGGAYRIAGAVNASKIDSAYSEGGGYAAWHIDQYGTVTNPRGSIDGKKNDGTWDATGQHTRTFNNTIIVERIDPTNGNSSVQICGNTDEFMKWLDSDNNQYRWYRIGGYLRLRSDTLGVEPIVINETNGKLNTVDTDNGFLVAGTKVVGARVVRPGTPTLTDIDNCLAAHGLWG